jgi:hypothetical protein
VRVLDLFTGVGGAAAGYVAAGHDVVGVDIAPQPDNPNPFIQADVLSLHPEYLAEYDFIHASPPCQAYCTLIKGTHGGNRGRHPELYTPVREMLEAIGKPYVIENPAARPDVVLCGEMFGLGVLRHRRFELGGWEAERPKHLKHRGRVRGWRHGEFFEGPYVAVYGNGGGKGDIPQWQDAMGIHWTNNRKSIAEAIPPAYTKWIGDQFTEWSKSHG